MRQALIRCEQEHGTEHTHRGSARHVANLPVMDRIFHQCIDHPRVLPILEHFLEPSLILGSLNSRIVRPGDGFQDLHSDIPIYMLNMDTPVMMNTVWMLDDFTPEIGGTRVVPGSHKSRPCRAPGGIRSPARGATHRLGRLGDRLQRPVLARRRCQHRRPQPPRPLRPL